MKGLGFRGLAWILGFLLLANLTPWARGQGDGILHINDPIHRFLLQQQTRGLLPDAHLSHLPLSAYEARHYLELLDDQRDRLSPLDQTLLARYLNHNPLPLSRRLRNRIPLLYRNGLDFFSTEGSDYGFQINPLLYTSGGYATRERFSGPRTSFIYWQNTRGVRVSGHIGRHLFFESQIEENQRTPRRLQFDNFTAPRHGRVKYPDTRGFTPSQFDRAAYDYVQATGVLGFRSKYFEVRLGRDRNRWGLGRASVNLSDYASPYDQLQIRTTIWRFQYTNVFARFTDHNALPRLPEGRPPEQIFPRRYGTFHRLAFKFPGRFEFSIFEAVIFAPDSTGRRINFDLSYLNPVIFFRAVELDLGSPDNAVLGAGLSWILQPGVKLYTEFLFDEFKISELRTPSDGWWGNKWSWQLGVHAVNVIPVVNMSMRGEYTRTRPYTYSHRDPRNAYLNYNDLLGHPAGPNTEELAFFLDFQPTDRWTGALTLVAARAARNTDSLNYGSNPAISYDPLCDPDASILPDLCRPGNYGLGLLAGVGQYKFLIEGHLGYELLPHLIAEITVQGDYISDRRLGKDWYLVPYLTLRWGLPFQSDRY